MRTAALTWALVVGIDEYDDPTIPRLTGAARDAVAAVHWLRRLGVPDSQILLHADPSPAARAEVDACGRPYKGGTFNEIAHSLLELRKQSGPRLFVFLTGHGLFEPAAQRVFITRDANQELTLNIGLDWLTSLLRGSGFTTSVVVMDGCLNQPYSASIRSKFEAGVIPALAVPPPRPENTVVACYSASQQERALEVNGHGLFLQPLLRALDPQHPSPFAALIDDTTGDLRLDLRRAVLDEVGPTVTRRAAEVSHTQNPTVSVVGRGENWRDLTVVEVPAPARSQVRVVIDPTDAAVAVRQIQLWADETAWRRVVPSPPDVAVTVPVVCVLPSGTALSIRCLLQAGAPYRPPDFISLATTADQDVVVQLTEWPQLQAAAGESVGAVHTVTRDGHPAYGMTDRAYEALGEIVGSQPFPVQVESHETGPVLHVPHERASELPRVLHEVADLVDRSTPPDISVVTVQHAPEGEPTRLRLLVDRAVLEALRDALGDHPVVELDDARLSAAELLRQDVIEVEPGPTHVSLTLPWGSSSTVVTVPEGQTQDVEVDTHVGVPPLLVQWRLEHPGQDLPLGPVVVPVGAGDVRGRLVDPTTGVATELPIATDGDHLAVPLTVKPWRDVVEIDHAGQTFAFVPEPTMATAWAPGPMVRAEPLAALPSWEWHLLVSTGRIDALTPQEAETLTDAKWVEPVLGVAGAYACYAQRQDDYLARVLDNLERLGRPMPADVVLLRAALDRRLDVTTANTREALDELVADAKVPVLTWGVPIGILASEHYHVPALAARLRDIESRCLAASTWTLWRTGGSG